MRSECSKNKISKYNFEQNSIPILYHYNSSPSIVVFLPQLHNVITVYTFN